MPADVGGIAGDRLKSFVERIERLRGEKKAIEEDLKEVFAEAKGTGFDVPAIKAILKERAADPDKLSEHEALVDVYRRALGMAPDFETGTPLASRAGRARDDFREAAE